MTEKPGISDLIPTARRNRSPLAQQPAEPPTIGSSAVEDNNKDSADGSPGLQAIAALRAMQRPNSKGAVNLNLTPDLKARLDKACFVTKVPRVQIATAALDEFLKRNGF